MKEYHKIIDGGVINCNYEQLHSCVSNVVQYNINKLDLHFIPYIDQWVYTNSQTLLTLIVNVNYN